METPRPTVSGTTTASDQTDPVVDVVEATLKRVSRFLVSSAGTDLDGVLEVLGDALKVDSVYFIAAPGAPPSAPGPSGVPLAPTYLSGRVVTWTRDGRSDSEHVEEEGSFDAQNSLPPGETGRDASTLAVPLLAEDEQLVGYLGIGRSLLGDLSKAPYDRVLSVVGDVLGTHLARLALEEARSQTEERWRQLVDRHPDPTLVVVRGVVTYANTAAAALLGASDPSDLVGRELDDFVSAEDVTGILSARDAQLQLQSPTPFEHAVIRTDGDVRTVESVSVPFPGVEGGVQTVLRDLTERRASDERHRAFVQTTSDGIWRVRLDRPVGRARPTRVITDHVLTHGRFAELNPAMVQTLGASVRVSVGLPLRRLVGAYGSRLVRALVGGNYTLQAHEISALGADGVARHLSVSAMGRFERDDLVEIWGTCTEITERVEMERRLVAVLEDQQERIGRDLHDSVGQLLTGVRMLSESLAAREAGGEHAGTAARIAAYSAEALDRVRAICHGLVPPQLYSEGAAEALAELVEHVDQLGPVRCVFRREQGVDLSDPEAALQAYRIAQEAVSNALRHSGCEVIWVTLSRDGGDVVVEIEDDGRGFEVGVNRSRSIGLYGMRRRANSVGASLTLETAPGSGTTVRVTFPDMARRASRPSPDNRQKGTTPA